MEAIILVPTSLSTHARYDGAHSIILLGSFLKLEALVQQLQSIHAVKSMASLCCRFSVVAVVLNMGAIVVELLMSEGSGLTQRALAGTVGGHAIVPGATRALAKCG